jgi:hypothetical protein
MSGDKEWTKGVYVSTSPGTYKLIPSTRAAISLLMSLWPTRSGNRYLDALVISQAVMDSRLTPDHARQALLKAAKEAGVEVEEGPEVIQRD